MSTKHTPGEWKVCPIDYGVATHKNFIQVLHVAAESGTIAWLTDHSHAHATEEQFANARLIAAAPELLDVLKTIVDLWGVGCSSDEFVVYLRDNGFMDTARALLAEIEAAS